MIRRELTLESGAPLWLLISQVQHARISGELARAWNEEFSDEVVAAITHHDDGWAAWEANPTLDPRHGRPYSFMEMSLADAITIWEGSISSARSHGPLAGWIVAGHFMGLVGGSDRSAEPLARNWLREVADKRAVWLAEWRRESPAHSLELAEHSQRMLLVADLLSLWLCGDGPVAGGDSTTLNTEMQSRSTSVSGSFQVLNKSRDFRISGETRKLAKIDTVISIAPWPMMVRDLSLATEALAVPADNYRSWKDLRGASWPIELHWRLKPVDE